MKFINRENCCFQMPNKLLTCQAINKVAQAIIMLQKILLHDKNFAKFHCSPFISMEVGIGVTNHFRAHIQSFLMA